MRNSKIDFIMQKSGQIIPIEVKSGINLKAKSLKAYIDKYSPEIAIRTSLADYKKTGLIYDIPLYAIGSMAEIIDGGRRGLIWVAWLVVNTNSPAKS